MSQSTKLVLTIVGVVAALAVVTLGLNTINQNRNAAAASPAPLVSTAGSPTASAGSAQLNDGGNVQIQITFDPKAASQNGTVSFAVSMNTHSVELGQFDLSKLSKLVLEPGGTLDQFVWKPDAEGHHVSGTLTVKDPSGLISKAKSITLEIRNLAGVDVRRFQWQGNGQ